MIKKWRKMSRPDRARTQILLVCALLALYAPLYLNSSEQLFESEKNLNRRKNRIETRTNIDGIDSGGFNLRGLERKIEKANAQLQTVSADFEALHTHFAPLNSADAQQQLMLEISTLAEESGVQLLSVFKKGDAAQGEATIAVDHVLGRPLINVTAIAPFEYLLYFLNELETLSYHVSVVNLKLYTSNPNENPSATQATTSTSGLHIQLQLSL
jgi:hypothetical protein